MTRVQRAVLSALEGQPAFLSAQDLHARLRGTGESVGLTSVYRAVQALRDAGAVDEARSPSGETGYRVCATAGHHHHLSCVSCGATVEVEAPGAEAWVTAVAKRHGYRIEGHTLEVTGTCRSCRAAVASPG